MILCVWGGGGCSGSHLDTFELNFDHGDGLFCQLWLSDTTVVTSNSTHKLTNGNFSSHGIFPTHFSFLPTASLMIVFLDYI